MTKRHSKSLLGALALTWAAVAALGMVGLAQSSTAVTKAPSASIEATYADTIGEADPVQSMAQCLTEDGSGSDQALPCRWNAGLRGNGVGLSFVVTANPAAAYGRCYVYDTASASEECVAW